ncbi:MAG: amidohydrolase [Thermoplasmatota archaeon]
MTSLRIRNATIVTQDDRRRVLEGDVRVEDGRIVAVATPGAKGEAEHDIDGKGQVLIPGLMNLHTHLPMGLLRGYGDDMALEAWLRERIWPAEARFTAATMRAGADLGLLEMVRGGTTSFLDMYFLEAEAIAPAVHDFGMRAWLGEGMVDVGQTEAGEPNRKIGAIEKAVRDSKGDPLVRFCPAPHAPGTCHPETFRESARISKEHAVPLHTHCSETRTEVYEMQGRTGVRPLARVEETDALGPHTILAHCGWITNDEAARIGRAGASVAHCPVSNLKLATGGVCPVPELEARGVRVGLGTDGAASNNTLDMFQTMKFAALVQKQHRWDPTVLPAQRVLDMATREAAAALHRPDLGRIEVGATADMALVDFRRPHLVPRHDALSHLVYAAGAQDVSATIVHGRPLMVEGRVANEARILSAAAAAARELCP